MRKPLIAGNWKMHGSRASVKALLQTLLQNRERYQWVEIAVFPPFVYLDLAEQYLQGSPIHWGGQNICMHEEGAFTGEVSASMLLEFHSRYVIVGHSERRILYGETNADIAQKFALALKNDLRPILCVGETAAQRAEGLTLKVIEDQLAVALKLAHNLPLLPQAVIAYEPVWAIGTGQNASAFQVQEVHAAVRTFLDSHSPQLGAELRILYGGSVKPDNAKSLLAMPDVDGALVGGASLKADQFIEIAEQCKR